jgi:PAS domain S-box-containing protein
MLQASPIIIYQMVSAPTLQYTYISPNVLNILGVSQGDILKDGSFWQRNVHPDDAGSINIISGQGNKIESEYRFWFSNSKEFRWVKDIRSLTSANDSNGWIGALLDITERKIAEQKNRLMQTQLSATLDSLVDAVISINNKGIIIDLNPATSRMFGYSKENLLGQNVSILMPKSFSIHHDDYIRNYNNTGQAKIIGIGREVVGLHADGREFPIALSIAKVGEGDNLRFVGCCHDLSQMKKQQAELFQSEKLSAIGQLASSIAHDFNNILGIVRGYAEMLQHEGAEVARLSSPIIEASDRASAMISQLLDFSSSKQREVTLIPLNEHLLKLKPMLEKALSNGIVLEYVLSPDVAGVKIELSAFDNLMINMVVNAKHAMNEHGILRITTSRSEFAEIPSTLSLAPGRYIHIAIADNGCGMPEDVQKKIFEPFFTTKGQKGTGLGLASAYGMVQRCHGAIDVQSVVGEGTCFNLFFPEYACVSLVKQPPPLVHQSKPQLPPLMGLAKARKMPEKKNNPVILLVDDEIELLEMHALLLESVGYTVLKACSGVDALSCACKHDVDILLSDIRMPEMNGFELAKEIKQRYPQVAVQFISGFAEESMLKEPQFVTWYEQRLEKPVPMTQLLQRVSELAAVL